MKMQATAAAVIRGFFGVFRGNVVAGVALAVIGILFYSLQLCHGSENFPLFAFGISVLALAVLTVVVRAEQSR